MGDSLPLPTASDATTDVVSETESNSSSNNNVETDVEGLSNHNHNNHNVAKQNPPKPQSQIQSQPCRLSASKQTGFVRVRRLSLESVSEHEDNEHNNISGPSLLSRSASEHGFSYTPRPLLRRPSVEWERRSPTISLSSSITSVSSEHTTSYKSRPKFRRPSMERRQSFKDALSASASMSGAKALKGLRAVADSVHKIFANDPEYKRLQKIEKRRRAILKRTDLGFFRMLLFFDGTCLQAVLTEPMLYVTMLIYVLVRIGAYTGLPTFVSEIGSTDITTVGAFITFFLVFHTNNTIARFTTLYNASMLCEASIFETAAIASSNLPHTRALRLVRYMNAAHIAGYVGLGETYGYQNFFLPINESKRFLTEQELTRIEYINMDEGGHCYRELIVWCCDEVGDACRQGIISEMVAHDLRQSILKLRGAFATMYDYNDQPIPFFLTHFAVLMTFIFLPLVSISHGLAAGTGANTYWLRDIVEGIVVFLQAIVLLGLRTLANMLSDP